MKYTYESLLAAARSEADVVAVALDYVSTFGPEELAKLPPECRPRRMKDAEDLADLAIALTRQRIAASEPLAVLCQMEAFFAHACARISRLDRASSALSSSESQSATGAS